MKTLTLTLTIIFGLTITVGAATLTCSNSSLGGAQYATLTSAYSAAANGDTILLQNTGIQYSSPAWQKSLVVIGIGVNPDIQDTRRTSINALTIRSGSSGSQFHGLRVDGNVTFGTGTNNNVVFENCRISSIFQIFVQTTNLTITNCLFTSTGTNLRFSNSGAISALVSSCVFNGVIDGDNYALHSIVMDHCLFLRSVNEPIFEMDNATFRNSIFMNFAPNDPSSNGNTYENNIERVSATLPLANGNLHNTDPLLVNYTLGTLHSGAYDYSLQAGSPAIGAATSGSDIGPHGSNTFFSETFEPLIVPIVTEVSVQNAVVSPGGTINVNIQARTPNTD